MTKNAEERLFEAIGQISDELVREADCSCMDMEGYSPGSGAVAEKEPETVPGRHSAHTYAAKLGRYLKYLPVAACLCIVFGSAYYVVNNYRGAGSFGSFSKAENIEQPADTPEGAADQEVQMKDEADADGASGIQDAPDAGHASDDSAESGIAQDKNMNGDQEGAGGGMKDRLPVRYGAYQGPVFALTATGDTQKLAARRSLKADIVTETDIITNTGSPGIQPLLQITDSYQIKNTSDMDKTLQLLYPFTGVLNQAQDPDGEILEVSGQEKPLQISYSFGGSIAEYENMDSFMEALSGEAMKEYQEQALEKEADWGRQVSVYTISVQGKTGSDQAEQCVAGITVKGAGADTLTFGFDHSFEREEHTAYHCFFVSEDQEKRYLIVTGETQGEPELEFYTNLDCEEKAEGMQYQMQRQRMAYKDALRLCTDTAFRQMDQEYEKGIYAAELPEYMNADAAFRALTVTSTEDDFYDTLTERYHSTELQEISNRMFAEIRIVYAMGTVTIPAGETVKVTARTQKQQENGHYVFADGPLRTDSFRYDFLSGAQNRLRIKKTDFQLHLADEWEIMKQNMGLVQKRDDVWKTVLHDKDCYFILKK